MKPGFQRVAASLAALTLVSACSKPVGPSILGHWRAERVSVYSAQLPIGPDIVVSDTEILSPETGTSVQIKGIESKEGAATLDLPYGIGLTFFFDGADRMYLKVPLVGHIYYRRLKDNAHAAVAPQEGTPSDLTKKADPAEMTQHAGQSAGASAVPAVSSGSDVGGAQYRLALVAAKEKNSDAAIDHLRDAFKEGFRKFDLVESAPEMNTLRRDVRYRALVAKYR